MQKEKNIENEILLLQEYIKSDELSDNYYEFFKEAWTVLEPQTPLDDNWHIKYLCEIAQYYTIKVANRLPKEKDLIINQPPRTLKSYIFSIVLPVWAWIKYPYLKFISASHSRELSIEHCAKSRFLIESKWFKSRWGNRFSLKTDQNAKSNYENNMTGKRMAHSTGGGTIGWGADIIIADDIMSPKNADSELERKTANDYYNNTLYTRLNDQNIGLRIVVQQRLHEDDTTGSILKIRSNNYKLISIPAEITSACRPIPEELSKNYINNLMIPARYSREVLDDFRKSGSRFYNSQLLQAPVEAGGSIFKRSNWRYYRDLPRKINFLIASWDLPHKEGEDTSFCAGQVWGRYYDSDGLSKFFLMYRFKQQVGFLKQVEAIIKTKKAYPLIAKTIIEEKANGSAAIDILIKGEKWNEKDIHPERPDISKEARALSISYLQEAGRCYLPHPDIDPTIEDYINELASFPKGQYNDQVDATSQALKYLNDDIDPVERTRSLIKAFGGKNG